MFSEALATLDRNTQEYMVDEMRKEFEMKDSIIVEKDSAIKKRSAIIKSTLQNAIQSTIEISKDLGVSKEKLIPKLMDKCNLNLQESTDYIEKY